MIINRIGKLIDDGIIKIVELIHFSSFHLTKSEDHTPDTVTMIDIVEFDNVHTFPESNIAHSFTHGEYAPTKTFSDSFSATNTNSLTTGRIYSDTIAYTPSKLFHVVKQYIEIVTRTFFKTFWQPEYPDTVTYSVTPTIMQKEYPDTVTYSSVFGIAQSKNIESVNYTISSGVKNAIHIIDGISYTISSGVKNAIHIIDPVVYTPGFSIEPPRIKPDNINYSFTLWMDQPTYTDKVNHKFYLTLSQE